MAAIATTLVVGLAIAVSVGIGIVNLWPAAREWAQIALGAGDFAAASRVVAQAVLGDGRTTQLNRTGKGMLLLSAAAASPELAEVLRWTPAMPALRPLLQNGSYRKALEEALRQNIPNIAQIRLDRVASPEVRAMLAEVQQAVARNPQGAEAASAVNANVLRLRRSESFTRLCQNPDFSRFLSGAESAKEAE